LQAYYDIEQEKKKQPNNSPDLSKLRQILFWDTKLDNINWGNQKKAVIIRIFERGNENEKKEISRFYGESTVNEVLANYGK
jgi:hypothetical protein